MSKKEITTNSSKEDTNSETANLLVEDYKDQIMEVIRNFISKERIVKE